MNHTSRVFSIALFIFTVISCSQSCAKSKDAVRITDKGTYYEVLQDYTQGITNFEMGEQTYQKILLAIPHYETIIDSYLAEIFPTQDIYMLMLSRVDDLKPQIPDRYKEEIDGMGSKTSEMESIAGDGKLSAAELYLMQLLPDIARTTECSGISVFGSRSATGTPITARILDWYGGAQNQLPKIQAVTTVKNTDKSICMIGYLGFIGILTAFNSDGVFAGILDSPSELPYSSTNKRSYISDIRLALESFSTIVDVATFLSDTSKKYTFNHLVLLSDKNSSGVLENNFSGTGLNTRRALRTDTSLLNPGITWEFPNAVATVNSFLLSGNLDNHSNISNNTARWDSFKKELQTCGNEVTISELRKIVSYGNVNDPLLFSDGDLYSQSTQHIVLFQPSDFHLEVSFRPKMNSLPDAPVFEIIPINFATNVNQKTRHHPRKRQYQNRNLLTTVDESKSISFKLLQPAHIEIKLFDAFGRMVRSDDLGLLSAGEHQKTYSTNELRCGLYYYSINEQNSCD